MLNNIIKFEKNGCQPCQSLSKWLEENKVEHESKNIMQNMDLVRKYNIKSVPTVLVLNENQEEVERFIGFNVDQLQAELLAVV